VRLPINQKQAFAHYLWGDQPGGRQRTAAKSGFGVGWNLKIRRWEKRNRGGPPRRSIGITEGQEKPVCVGHSSDHGVVKNRVIS